MPTEPRSSEAVSRTVGQDTHEIQVLRSSAARTEQLDELERLLSLCEVQPIRSGMPVPLGARARGNGVNFAIFSRHATGVRLDFFDHPEDSVPARSILLDSARNKTVTSGICGWRGLIPANFTDFALLDPTLLTKVTASIRTSSW